jgi:hypothetical protein
LLLFQLDRLLHHLLAGIAGLAPVRASVSKKRIESAVPVAVEFAPQGCHRRLGDLAVGEKNFFFGKIF